MSAEAFCFLAARKKPGNLAAMIALLAEPERSRIRALLDAPPATEDSREAELRALSERAARKAGVPADRIPPRILDWLIYGIEDRQS